MCVLVLVIRFERFLTEPESFGSPTAYVPNVPLNDPVPSLNSKSMAAAARSEMKKRKPTLETKSKALTWVLRHKAVELGIDIDDEGYVLVKDLLSTPRVSRLGVTEEDIREVC